MSNLFETEAILLSGSAEKPSTRGHLQRTESGAANLSQSHAGNAFYRYKRIIEGRLRAKNDDAQKREAAIGCAILNQMLEMGEPLSLAVG